MYSGSDSNESQKYANWALNPTTFQNVPGEQVDWAALAQQWIIMKEAGPPPIPGEQNAIKKKKSFRSEGGEAEMDMENDKEPPPPPTWSNNEAPPAPGAEAWNWNNQGQSWNNWNNSWTPPVVPPPAPKITNTKSPLLPTPSSNSYIEPPESTSDNAVPFGSYNSNTNNEYSSTSPQYWNNSSTAPKHIKPHNKRYSKVNVPIRASAPLPAIAIPVEPPPPSTPTPTLDTAKRKQLPAWIREGLEKMEKEKLREMEKQKEMEERESYLVQNKQSNQDTMEILKSTMKERQKSRFESDGENSDEDKRKRKRQKSAEPVPLTQEELMLKVRRTMTEILLTVTNRHIEAVCKEELQRYSKNRKASEAASAPSGANIRGRLGLGIYGGDDSGSSSEDERDEEYRDSRDSDDELKDTIKKKMTDFQKTEREIEDKLEEADRRKEGSVSRSPSPESIDNDSQVDARTQDRKYFQHDTRQPSPPKTNQEPKSKPRSPSTSSQESEYSNNKSKTSRRSSSSDSKESYKISSKKRSVTPEKRYRSTSSRWSKSPSRRSESRRDSSSSKRDSGGSRKKSTSSKRSRSRSYSRSRRSRSSSYKKSRRSRSRERSKRSRSSSRSRYSSRRSPSSSRSERRRRRRSRSDSSGRGKRSHRH